VPQFTCCFDSVDCCYKDFFVLQVMTVLAAL